MDIATGSPVHSLRLGAGLGPAVFDDDAWQAEAHLEFEKHDKSRPAGMRRSALAIGTPPKESVQNTGSLRRSELSNRSPEAARITTMENADVDAIILQISIAPVCDRA